MDETAEDRLWKQIMYLLLLVFYFCGNLKAVSLESVSDLRVSSSVGSDSVLQRNNGSGKNVSVCEMDQCNCNNSVHKSWIYVNCSFDNKQMIELAATSLPVNVENLIIRGGRELRISPGAFSRFREVPHIELHHINNIQLRKYAFSNASGSRLQLEISDCGEVIVETDSFMNIKCPVSINVVRTAHLLLQKNAFSYLLDLKVQNVSRFDLTENALKFEYPPHGRHGPTTKIHLINVIIPSLPRNTFSSAAEILVINSEIRNIRQEAFKTNTLTRVAFINTTIHQIETKTFPESTLLHDLEFINCHIKLLQSEAIIAAVGNFTIQHTTINEMHPRAISTVSVYVTITESTFEILHEKGFEFRDWNRINVEHNVFKYISGEAMDVMQFNDADSSAREFRFLSNELFGVVDKGLKFITDLISKSDVLEIRSEHNSFAKQCHCTMKVWLGNVFGTNDIPESIFETSSCKVDLMLSRCFNVAEGYVNMRNFTDLICGKGEEIKCLPTTKETQTVIDNASKEYSLRSAEKSENKTKLILIIVLSFVFFCVFCTVIIMLLVKGSLWLKRKGYCLRFRGFAYSTNDEMGTTEAEDIMVTVENKMNEQEEEDTFEDEHLPEELTPELLQVLREKLDNPDTYNEAREMIEKLYDHFLIEDTYNTNENAEPEDAHLYEELNMRQVPPPPTPINESDKTVASRPFSFLRLIEERLNLPFSDEPSTSRASSKPKTILMGEYAEPVDADRLADNHVYSELPDRSTQTNNNIKDKMAFRPLPDKPKQRDDLGEGTSSQVSRRF